MAHKRWVVNLDGREHVIELAPDFGLVSATFVAEGGDAPSVNGRPLRYDPQVRRWTFRQ